MQKIQGERTVQALIWLWGDLLQLGDTTRLVRLVHYVLFPSWAVSLEIPGPEVSVADTPPPSFFPSKLKDDATDIPDTTGIDNKATPISTECLETTPRPSPLPRIVRSIGIRPSVDATLATHGSLLVISE